MRSGNFPFQSLQSEVELANEVTIREILDWRSQDRVDTNALTGGISLMDFVVVVIALSLGLLGELERNYIPKSAMLSLFIRIPRSETASKYQDFQLK